MAKSIFEILDDLKTETSVPEIKNDKGVVSRKNFGTVEHTIPRKLFPTSEQFEDAEKLLAWSNENGFTHALLQAGLQKGLIDCRATFKAVKKDETWTPEYGQANLDKMAWSIVERPKAGGSKAVDSARYADCLKMIGNLCLTKMPTDQIKQIAIPVYGEELVNSIFSTLENMNKGE